VSGLDEDQPDFFSSGSPALPNRAGYGFSGVAQPQHVIARTRERRSRRSEHSAREISMGRNCEHPAGLGVGVVWWPILDDVCRQEEGLVDVIEAEPEAFWLPKAGGFRSLLAEALSHLPQPKLLHGVGAPVGGTCPPPDGHLSALLADIAALRPEYVSEHLSITRFRPTPDRSPASAGFMLPPLQSEAGVLLAAVNIRRRRAALGGIPLAVETPVNYLPPARGEWPDGVYVAATVEAADCAILLDLHNVLCNARNGRQSVAAFCDALPLERVWEIHLAGGESEGGLFLDAHAGLVEPELMEIAADLVPRLPNLRAINFEIMPERVAEVGLAAIAARLCRMKELWNCRAASPEPQDIPLAALPPSEPTLSDPAAWETLLGCAITGLPEPAIDEETAAWWRACTPAIDIYRMLVREGRASAVASAAPHTTRELLRHFGGTRTREILADHWRLSPPGYTSADEARAFFEFLTEVDPSLPGLADAIASDLADLDKLSAMNLN
jgi:uncharacterized protein (UPF0276 family)